MKLTAWVGVILALLAVSAGGASAQSWREVSKSRQLRGQDFLDVDVQYAVGRFTLQQGSERTLYRVASRYDEDVFTLLSNYLESEGRGSLQIEIDGEGGDVKLKNPKDYDYQGGSLLVELSGAVPTALNLEFGAAEASLDLGGIRVTRLVVGTGASDTRLTFSEPNREVAEYCEFKAGAASFRAEQIGNSGCARINISGGVGQLELDFSGEWKHDATGTVSVGLGSVDIRLPPELGVRIERSTFLMAFDAPGFEKQDGGVWLSQNWESARRHLTLTLSGAFGGIKIARR
jgi:hypothetical protein